MAPMSNRTLRTRGITLETPIESFRDSSQPFLPAASNCQFLLLDRPKRSIITFLKNLKKYHFDDMKVYCERQHGFPGNSAMVIERGTMKYAGSQGQRAVDLESPAYMI